MSNRLWIWLLVAALIAGCGALTAEISRDLAPQISTEVAIQVGTAVAELPAADTQATSPLADAPQVSSDETGLVTRVVDGDTIDVLLNGVNTRIRYLQMNTPERDHPCFDASSKANADLVAGKTVRLVPDKELVDRYDRLLRFVYVDDVLVNRVLVEQGWAEVVLYPPNDLHYDEFMQLEKAAAAAGLGCHPSGVFADGSMTR